MNTFLRLQTLSLVLISSSLSFADCGLRVVKGANYHVPEEVLTFEELKSSLKVDAAKKGYEIDDTADKEVSLSYVTIIDGMKGTIEIPQAGAFIQDAKGNRIADGWSKFPILTRSFKNGVESMTKKAFRNALKQLPDCK